MWSNPGESANGLDDGGNGHIDGLRGWDFIGSDDQPRDRRCRRPPITLIPPALPPVEPISIIAPATLRLDRRGAVTIRVAFPAGTPAGTGRAELVRGGAATRIGAKSFATKPGDTVRVRIRLTKAGRRLVARRKRVNATLRVTVQSQVQTKQTRIAPRRR